MWNDEINAAAARKAGGQFGDITAETTQLVLDDMAAPLAR